MRNKIVMAEDDLNIGRLAYFTLKRDGFNIIWEKDGQSALDRILLMPPDLVILDIEMPRMNGYQVYEKLKENKKTKNIPVMFMTAMGEREDVVKGIRLGVDDYIVKPFEPKVLAHRVRKIMATEEKENETIREVSGELRIVENKKELDTPLGK